MDVRNSMRPTLVRQTMTPTSFLLCLLILTLAEGRSLHFHFWALRRVPDKMSNKKRSHGVIRLGDLTNTFGCRSYDIIDSFQVK